MAFAKGNKGRPRGAVNKTTATVKAAFAEAFERKGGATSLLKWAKDNETEFYKLASKLIPTEITGEQGGPITVRFITESRTTTR